MSARQIVKIVGAGPAGLAAAICLRKHGFPVRVYEKAPDVGHRLNGDFQGLENWSSESDITEQLKAMGIETNFLCVPYYGGTIYAAGMEPVRIESKRPIFYLVRRGPMPGALDSGLKEQALSSGVEILFQRRFDEFEGKAIVGIGPRAACATAVGITFTTTMEDSTAVAFDDDFAPKGYAYLLVYGGYGTMATVLYRERRRGRECFEKVKRFFVERTGLRIENEKGFAGFGDFFLSNTQVRNGSIYVGESAGFQDCLWSFGMRYAMVSGWLAAKSYTDGSDYDRLWKRELKPLLETSLINRYLFEKFGHAGYRYLARRLARGEPCRYLRKHYNRSLWKQFLLPLARRGGLCANGTRQA